MRLSLPNVKQNFGKRTLRSTGAEVFNKALRKVKTFERSAAEQDISFYLNFDFFLFCFWALNVISHFSSKILVRYVMGTLNVIVHDIS